jgi:UPF0716 family protein affecting phage T7 exclusion
MTDHAEAWANAVVGLAISTLIVVVLRALGVWNASPLVITAVFFGASVARSYVLRRAFRWYQEAREG